MHLGRTKRLCIVVVATLFINLVASMLTAQLLPRAEAASVITFADPNLEAVVREAISKPTGDIYDTNVNSLNYLSADSRHISNLAGIENLTNLTELSLYNNPISDVSPLSGLTNLTKLNLFINQISDVSPLSGLTNLTELNLYNNQISDVSPLSGLTNLTSLSVTQNQISDVSPLSGLTNLASLSLYQNQISDVSPLSGLTNLSWLDLADNQMSDINPLGGLTNLCNLKLNNNQISNITPLSGLTNLDHLELGNNQISNISVLSGLTNLDHLELGNNQISNISILSGLTDLTWLSLLRNQISDVSALSGLINLTELNLYNNQIIDVSPLGGLTNLTELNLYINQISDVSPLGGLTNLTYLHLAGNQISDVSSLGGLTNLDFLNLYNNQISDISPLGGLTNLTTLSVTQNQISDVSIITGLTRLILFRAQYNYLDLTHDSDDMQHINNLLGRGVNVYYTPQNQIVTGPTTTLSTDPLSPDGNEGWFKSIPTIILASDKPGTTYYSWDSSTGPWTTYTGSFVAPEGVKTLYYYSVDTVGNAEDIKSQTIKVDTTSPAIPNLSANAISTTHIELSWPASTDASSSVSEYQVYDATNTLIASIQSTSFIHSGLAEGQTYSYYVKAIDRAGNISGQSKTETATTFKEIAGSIDGGSNHEVNLVNGAKFIFDEVTSGDISVIERPPQHEHPSGFRLVRGSYYEIETTATFSGFVYVTLPYNPDDIVGEKKNLKLFHWQNNGWNDITVSVDTENNTITGKTTSFSPYAVGEMEGASGSPSVGGEAMLPDIFFKRH